jgi:hypothetical protein
MRALLSVNGELIEGLEVSVFFPRRQAPFRRFALINLNKEIPLGKLSGLEAKILLVLILQAKPLALKHLAQLVGTPTSCAVRALNRLLDCHLVEKPDRGIYRASRDIVHYGKWAEEEGKPKETTQSR